MSTKKKCVIAALVVIVVLAVLSHDFSSRRPPVYGISFSRFHADELGLDWKKVFLALLNDLGVRHFRFSAHWPLTEPSHGVYHFDELDFQMNQARAKGADVILAVGRRLPGWPECHIPDWVQKLPMEDQQKELLNYVTTVVNRYKKYPNLTYWQVSNEPYLTMFGRGACGEFDEAFLEREIALVKHLDPDHRILLTDSGELGTWRGAWMHGDVFGTSMYLYIWNRTLGPIRYPIIPAFFRIKHNLATLLFGKKDAVVIELSAEPWLLQPLADTPQETQLMRMGIGKFNEILDFSRHTGFDTFYLWGGEWWYWMIRHGHPEFWDRAKVVFGTEK